MNMILSSMREEEDESDQLCVSTLKFPFLPWPAATMLSPEHRSGTATPPLQPSASVPFKWEEQPGKPRPCTDIVVRPEPAKCLELPPCRMEPAGSRITRMPSPTTVLDGPYIMGRPKFSSFRLFREAQGSFDSSSSGGGSPRSSVDVLLGIGKKKITRRFWGRSLTVKMEVDGGIFGISPSSSTTGCDSVDEGCRRVKMEGKMKRNGGFSSFSRAAPTHLWVTMYESLKQAIPWKNTRKSKKERRA